jgi:hypothetical protein
MFRRMFAVLVLGLAFGSAADAAPILVVDPFTTPTTPAFFGSASAGTVTDSLDMATVANGLLGNRLVTDTNSAFNSGLGFNGNSSVSISGGQSTLGTAGTNITSVESLSYTFTTPLNLTGYNSMFTVASFNAGNGSPPPPTTLTIILTDNVGGTQMISGIPITSTGPLTVPLGGLTRSSTTNITFAFTQSNSADLTITPLLLLPPPNPVPEPTTLVTFGALALFGGYAARRKLKAAPVAQA